MFCKDKKCFEEGNIYLRNVKIFYLSNKLIDLHLNDNYLLILLTDLQSIFY